MMESIRNLIQGKTTKLQRISILGSESKVEMQMDVIINNVNYELVFTNVSRVSMDNLSWPMVIEGLEIVCNTGSGWDNSSRYMVHDYENDTFSFYCEGVNVKYKLENNFPVA